MIYSAELFLQSRGDAFSKLNTSEINLCVYELYRDKGKVLSLIDVIRAMLVKNYSNLDKEVTNYYEDKSSKPNN